MGDLFRCHRPGCPIAAPHVCPVDDPAEYLPSAPDTTSGSPAAPGDPDVPDAAHRSDVAAIEIIGQHVPQPDGNGGKVRRRPAPLVGEGGPERVQLGAGTLTYNIPSGVPWADQLRAIVRDHVADAELEDVVAELDAWFDAAGGVRYRQGYAAGASDRGQVR